MTADPQRPRLTFAVGITGHRPNKLPAEALARAESQLISVFAAIDSACAARGQADGIIYQDSPHRVRLVSSFAEGVDQLAVRLRPPQWDVTAVLPFPRGRYEEDFIVKDERGAIVSDHRCEFATALREAAEVVELPEGSDGAPACYARAGAYVLRQIDLLVAVWDGAEAAGRGGTAHVVAQALDGGIPVIWIASTREQAPWLIRHLADVGRQTPLADAVSGPIAQAVDAALAIAPSQKRRLQAFLAEEGRHVDGHSSSGAWLPHSWVLGRSSPPRGLGEIHDEWERFVAKLPESGGLKMRLRGLLLHRFMVAETLADDYHRAWRNAHFLCYLLLLLAVTTALVGVSPIGIGQASEERRLVFETILASLELLMLGAILAFIRKGGRQRWSERASDCRVLAEALRHLRFLAPIGECANQRLLPDAASKAPDWVLWYLRATIRELGSPMALLDGNYQRNLLAAAGQAEVDEGIEWQRENAMRLRRLELLILHLGEACLLSTIALLTIMLALFGVWLGLHFFVPLAPGMPPALASWEGRLGRFLSSAKPFVTFFAVLLPAASAIFAGLRLTGRFERMAERSMRCAAALQGLKPEYAAAAERAELDKTAMALLDTAKAKAEPIEACRSLYGRKRLTLPV